jgi:hypothetical protein
MKIVSQLALCAAVVVPLFILCACGDAKSGSTGTTDMGALCDRFRTNAPNDRLETVDNIIANLKADIGKGPSTNLSSQTLIQLLGKADKEVETIQTGGNVLVLRYNLAPKAASTDQYLKTDALVLRFKSNILVDVAKQQGWVPKGG